MTLAPDALDDLVIDKPGVYDIPIDMYHADPVPGGSLSSSGARKLMPPSCPALFRYWADHGQPPKREFDLGHAAHRLVLGVGEQLVVVDAADWRTKAAKQQRDEAYEAGAAPVLRAEYETCRAMAEALRAHPVAAALFDPDKGKAEQSLFWRDEPTGVIRRARLDWLPNARLHDRTIVPEYKTCASANPDALARAMNNFGYHQQAAWNIDAVKATHPLWADDAAVPDPAFVFVCQEKTPPYLVTIVEPDRTALKVGRRLNRQAIEVYAECQRTGVWPPYSLDVELIGLPPWVERIHLGDDW